MMAGVSSSSDGPEPYVLLLTYRTSTADLSTTHEHMMSIDLGEVLGNLRPHSWRVVSEQQGQLCG